MPDDRNALVAPTHDVDARWRRDGLEESQPHQRRHGPENEIRLRGPVRLGH